ncbi:MAG: right-handed parallel beta-helix repeat-containing protein [Pseudomonadota bacterium]
MVNAKSLVYFAALIGGLALGQSKASACDLTISPGTDINGTLAGMGSGKLCLNPGTYNSTTPIVVRDNQTVAGGTGNKSDVIVRTSSDHRAFIMGNHSRLQHVTVTSSFSSPANWPRYLISAESKTNITIWNTDLSRGGIIVGLFESSAVDLASNSISQIGDPNDDVPAPSIWIRGGSNIKVHYGTVTGWGPGNVIPSGPFAGSLDGDGTIQCTRGVLTGGGSGPLATNIEIIGTNMRDIGTGAFYLNGCDDAIVRNLYIWDSTGWAIDAPCSPGLEVKNVTIKRSGRGSIYFSEAQSGPGTFESNSFFQGNLSGVADCAGINVHNTPSNIIQFGNTIDSGTLVCARTVAPPGTCN